MTLTNSSGSEGVISFIYTENTGKDDTPTYEVTNDAGATLSPTSGQAFSYNMAKGETLKFTVTTAKGGYTSSIVLSNITFTPIQQIDIQLQPASNGSYTVTHNGTTETVTANKTVTVSNAVGATLTAAPASGYTFVGWRDVSTGKLISSDATYVEKTARTVKPEFITSSAAKAFQVKGGGTHYYLNDALAEVGNSGTIIVVAAEATVAAGNYTIPSGVTLLVPYNDAYNLITNNMDKSGNYTSKGATPAKELYCQLTMSDGANITVYGGISVGSQACSQMVGQVGPYGAIVMDANSSITIKNGGNLYAYGYIFYGANGGGTVTVESGGTVYETAFIMDYPGNATNTKELYDGTVFPMRAFTVRNVEVPMTMESGAKEYAFYSLYGTAIGGEYPGYFLFVGNDSSAPFCLSSGATLTKAYKDGKQSLVFSGTTSINSLSITIKVSLFGTYPVTSSETTGFPLPSGYEITVASGELTLGDRLIMMEGASITVAEGAVVKNGGNNVYVLDAAEDDGTVNIADVHGKSYTLVDEDAVIDINGTVYIDGGGLYTSAGNAQITSSKGTGKIVFTDAATAATTVLARKGGVTGFAGGSENFDMNSAQLSNKDGTYTNTGAGGTSNTYTYTDSFWRCATHTYGEGVVTPPTSTEQGYTTYTCSVCGHSYQGDFVPATGTPMPTYFVTISWSQTSTAVYTPAQTTYTWSPEQLKYESDTIPGSWSQTSVMTVRVNNSDSTGDVTAAFGYTPAVESTMPGHSMTVRAGQFEDAILTVTPIGEPAKPASGNEIVLGTITITLSKGGTP